MASIIRRVLFVCLALIGVGLGASRARAQTYDFTFSGSNGVSIPDLVVVLSNGNVTSMTGTVAWSGFPNASGAITYASTYCSGTCFFTNGSSFNLEGNGFVSGGTEVTVDLIAGVGNSQVFSIANGSTSTGDATVAGAPAPAAATGVPGLLALLIGAAWIKRRDVMRFTRRTFAAA